jgi:hypothetical protein
VGGIQAPQAGRLRLQPILRFVSRFEFVQSEWMNDRAFFGGSPGRDPISGAADGTGTFDIPKRPIRPRLQSLPRFVVTRGGEYCFLPGLPALQWLANLTT